MSWVRVTKTLVHYCLGQIFVLLGVVYKNMLRSGKADVTTVTDDRGKTGDEHTGCQGDGFIICLEAQEKCMPPAPPQRKYRKSELKQEVGL